MLTVDFQEYNKVKLAAEGEGYDALSQARKFLINQKREIKDTTLAKIDSGKNDNMYMRLENAQKAKDGILVDTKITNYFEIQKDKRETARLIKDCKRSLEQSKKQQKALSQIQIVKKPLVQNLMVSPMEMLNQMHVQTNRDRNNKQDPLSLIKQNVQNLTYQTKQYRNIESNNKLGMTFDNLKLST